MSLAKVQCTSNCIWDVMIDQINVTKLMNKQGAITHIFWQVRNLLRNMLSSDHLRTQEALRKVGLRHWQLKKIKNAKNQRNRDG